MTAGNEEPVRVCVAEIALDMCGRCMKELTGETGRVLNHWYAGDPELARCTSVSGAKFEPAPRLCLLPEEEHHDSIPELVEALRGAKWDHIPHYTGRNFGGGHDEGLLILAHAVATVLSIKPHEFKPGILCPTCNGERFLDELMGAVPGLRDGTRMPIVSGRKTKCSGCSAKGVIPVRNA